MPIIYHYGGVPPVLRITASGDVSVEERVRSVNAIEADPSLPAVAPILVDVNGASQAPTAAEIQIISALAERLRGRFRGRVAILNVVPGHVSISHLVVVLTSVGGDKIKVFMSESAAVEWLNGS